MASKSEHMSRDESTCKTIDRGHLVREEIPCYGQLNNGLRETEEKIVSTNEHHLSIFLCAYQMSCNPSCLYFAL